MDNADTRHGVQTAHEYTKRNIDSSSSEIFIEHTSRSQAILVGDMVFGWAYKSISKERLSDHSWDVVHELVEEVIVGQMMDIMTPLENTTSMNSVEKKMLLKTARYTFTRPLVLGALCAGKSMEDIVWLQEFGDSLGLMFQAQDDLLDITASISLLQKSTLGDIKNGVHTIVSVYVSNNANEEQKKIWDGWFGKNTDLNPAEVSEFLSDIGAIEYVENYISEKRSAAVDSLGKADISDEHKGNFRKIIEMLSHRKY
jgi:geranylgeranyl diphosphate synthase type I